MALIDLLKNENTFIFGVGGSIDNIKTINLAYGGPSKSIRYGANTGGRRGEKDVPNFHLFPRVTWFGDDSGGENSPIFNTNPTFEFGRDHSGTSLDGGGFRGGMNIFEDRRDMDVERIRKFLGSDQGNAFKRRQVALQLLNNHPNKGQRVYNWGTNLKAQIKASGLSHIKRAGTLPIPAIEERMNLTETAKGLGMVLEADYISYQKHKHYLREEKYSLGDPGARPSGNSGLLKALIGNVEEGPEKRREYDADYSERENLVDKINVQKVFKALNGVEEKFVHKDFIKFKFEVVDSDNPQDTDVIVFRAYLDSFGDGYNATHNEIKYNGRGEHFYTFNSFKRTITLSFKVAAQTRYEMKPLYQKLNYLAAQTAPNYSDTGRIRTPYMRITVGDYLSRVPGVVTNISLDWSKEYPWEIAADSEKKDMLMKQLPHMMDVNIGFTPIHSFTPENHINTPFIGIGNYNSVSKDGLKGIPIDGSWLGFAETTDSEGNTLTINNHTNNPDVLKITRDEGVSLYDLREKKLSKQTTEDTAYEGDDVGDMGEGNDGVSYSA